MDRAPGPATGGQTLDRFPLGITAGIYCLGSVECGFPTAGKYKNPHEFTFSDFPPRSKEEQTGR